MLNYFHHRRRVESAQTFVAIHQRPMQQFDPLPLYRRQLIQVKSSLRSLQSPPGDVHSGNSLECPVLKKSFQQAAFPTSQINHTLGARGSECRQHCSKALFPELQGRLDFHLFSQMLLLVGSGSGVFIQKFRERAPREPVIVAQVACCDGFFLGVRCQPSLALAE